MRISIPLAFAYGLVAGLYLHSARRSFVGVLQLSMFDAVFMSVSSAGSLASSVLFAVSLFEQSGAPSLKGIGTVVVLMRLAVAAYSLALIYSANFDDRFIALLSAKAMSGAGMYSAIVYTLMLGSPSCVKLLPLKASGACAATGGYPNRGVMRNSMIADVTLCVLLLGVSAAVDNLFSEYRTTALVATLLVAIFYLMYVFVTSVIALSSSGGNFSDGSADPLKDAGDETFGGRDSVHSVNSDLFLASPHKLSPERTSVNTLDDRAQRNSGFTSNPMLFATVAKGATTRSSLTKTDDNE